MIMKIKITKRRCPKCGSRNFQIDDWYEACYIYQVEDGVITPDGVDNDGCDHIRTVCTCLDCGNNWHPKNLYKSIVEKEE